MDTIRERIIQKIIARLAIIRTSNGFQTDCGQHVFRAWRQIDDSIDLPAIIVWPREEAPDPRFERRDIIMPVDLELFKASGSVTDTSAASVEAEKMLGDAIEALLGNQWEYTFDEGANEPSPGGILVGQTSEESAVIQAVSVSSGTWGGGDAEGTITIRRKTGDFTLNEIGVVDLIDSFRITETAGTGVGYKYIAVSDLATDIIYIGGGQIEYPDSQDIISACRASFNIIYRTVTGDPYRF